MENNNACIIAICNLKGGVGKSTTTINLGAAIANEGYKVLLIDMDSQGHVAIGLKSKIKLTNYTLGEFITGKAPFSAVVCKYNDNLSVLPSNRRLNNLADILKDQSPSKRHLYLQYRLKNSVTEYFDFVLIDCPPELGLLVTNALAAADWVLIPADPSTFALKGTIEVQKLSKTLIKGLNSKHKIAGIIPIRFNTQTAVGKKTADEYKSIFGDLVLKSNIRQCVQLEEANRLGVSVYDHRPSCAAGIDYDDLCKEVLERIRGNTDEKNLS